MPDDLYIGPLLEASRMRDYDNLPREARDELKYGLAPWWGWNKTNISESARSAYGEDHPQAQGEFCCPLKR